MENERQVVLGEVSPDDALSSLDKAPETTVGAVQSAIPNFKEVSYRSFKAEWALIGKDIQVKFYLPKHAQLNSPEARKAWMDYWLNRFPEKLDLIAREHFEADRPRLIVRWTEEFASWWFRASSYAYLLSVEDFLLVFFEKLDSALQRKEDEG